MKKQAAEAKPETKDIKAEEQQKPKVPAPQWAGVGSPSVRTLRPLIPAFRTSPSFPSVNDGGSKSALRLLNPIPLPLPSLNLGTDLHLRSIPERTARTLTQLLNPGPTNSFNPRSDQELTHPSTPVPTTAPQPDVSPG